MNNRERIEGSQQRGFSVLEVLIATTLLLALALATLGVVRGLVRALDRRGTAQSGALALENDIARMRADADTAFAVFVPNTDIFGEPNDRAAGRAAGHEVDFYAKTDNGAETWWAYRFDGATQTLRRYDYDAATRTTGIFDRGSGRIIAGAYPAVTGVRSFTATTIQANALTDSQQNAFAPVLLGLTGHRAPTADPVGFVPAGGVPRPDLYGGNTTVRITLRSDRGERLLHLASGAAASGFTIHEVLAIRAFAYRKNTHHRSFFGLISNSRAHVYEQLQYNLHPRDPTSPWQVWCDYEIYGNDSKMHYDSSHARYDWRDFLLTTGYAFFSVTHQIGSDLAPLGNCQPRYPTADDTPPPLPPTPQEIVTPPPCWIGANPCWPYNAPPDWTPPSPWPQATPPPDWCAGHQQSHLCGGSGSGPTPTSNPGTAPPVSYTPTPTATPMAGTSPEPRPTRNPIRPEPGPGHGGGIITQ